MNERKLLFIIYIISAATFVILLSIHPYPFSFILKSIPTVLFAYLCFKYLKMAEKLFMGIGFICCTCGDIFLDFSRELYFIHALVSFLVGHILYCLGFIQRFTFSRKKLPLALCVFLYTLIIMLLLFPKLGSFLLPVSIYILVITVMGICAAFVTDSKIDIFIGAMIFIISDSLIAINKFLFPFPYSTAIIISLYFIAQYIIGTGMLRTPETREIKE